MARTLKHEKYIVQRNTKKGYSFQVYFHYRDCNGKNCIFQNTINGDRYGTPKEALAAACIIRDEALRNIRSGYNLTKKMTVEQCISKIPDLYPISYTTQLRIQSLFRATLEKYGFGPKEITKITAAEVQESVIRYSKVATQDEVKRLVSTWRKIYHIAQIEGVAVTDKTLLLQPIKSKIVKMPKNVSITREQFEKFLSCMMSIHCRSPRQIHRRIVIWYLLQIMLYCGLRPAEALALTRKDLHLYEPIPYLSITKAIGSNFEKQFQIVPTKTTQSIRDVPIPYALKTILLDLEAWSKFNLLLADYDGNPMSISFISNYIAIVSKNTGIPFNSYMLRHMFSTDLFAQHVNPRVIQDLMGHESESMSLYYARSTEEDRLAAVNGRGNLMLDYGTPSNQENVSKQNYLPAVIYLPTPSKHNK